MNVYLMRHGKVENPKGILYGDAPGFHLSETGKLQAKSTAEYLKNKGAKIAVIVCSPLDRAQETAEFFSREFNLAIILDERVTEWGMGHWVGGLVENFYKMSGYFNRQMNLDGLEPLEYAADRVLKVIDELVIKYPNEDVLIVSHRESMAAAVLKLQNKPWKKIHALDMPVGSLWRLEYQDGKFFKAGLEFAPE